MEEEEDALALRRRVVEVARVYEQDKAGLSHADVGVTRGGTGGASGSGYDEQEAKREARANAWVADAREVLASATSAQRAAASRGLAARVAKLEAARELTRVWFHCDMDAFYAACEVRENESLRDVPFAVGGLSMITTANYHARTFGVRSAMPGFIGRRLCPELVFVRPDFTKYVAAAEEVRAVLREFDDDPLVVGLDEAYVDVTPRVEERLRESNADAEEATGTTASAVEPDGQGATTSEAIFQAAHEIACELKRRVREATGGLTMSVGFAANRMLAKVCSDMRKPDGVFGLRNSRDEILAFTEKLPVQKVSGIGRVTRARLNGIGIESLGELLQRGVDIECIFSELSADFLVTAALGLGPTSKPPRDDGDVRRKGISCERTFRPSPNPSLLKAKLHEIATTLAADARHHRLHARCVTLKMKTARFEQFTRARSLKASGKCIGSEEEEKETVSKLYAIAVSIFDDAYAKKQTSYRLLGIRLSDFLGQEQVDADQRTIGESLLLQQQGGDAAVGRVSGAATTAAAAHSGGRAIDAQRHDLSLQVQLPSQRTLDVFFPKSAEHVVGDAPSYAPLVTTADDNRDCTVADSRDSDENGEGTAGDASTSAVVVCDVCGARILNNVKALQEHADFHFALKLYGTQREERRNEEMTSLQAGGQASKRAKKAPPSDIRRFFQHQAR